MSNKLQNVKAIKQMLAGEHRSQTRKSIYTGKTKSKESEVIESFDDGKPKGEFLKNYKPRAKKNKE